MNWLDIIMLILAVGLFIGAVVALVVNIKDDNTSFGIFKAFVILLFEFIPMPYFVVLDKGVGSTIGTITSVDKNFFGTTSLYIKTSENTQEKYCIENEDIVNVANELIGQNVKISYGERVGLYSTNKCHSAPVEMIEQYTEEE